MMMALDAHDNWFRASVPSTARRVVRRAPLERGGVVLARGGERATRLRVHTHCKVRRSLAPPGGLASRAHASCQGAARGEVKITHGLFILIVSRRVRVGRGVVQRPGEARGVVFPRQRGGRARVALRGRFHPSTRRWRARAWTSVPRKALLGADLEGGTKKPFFFSPFVEKVLFWLLETASSFRWYFDRSEKAARSIVPLTFFFSDRSSVRERSPKRRGTSSRASGSTEDTRTSPPPLHGVTQAPATLRARAVPRRSVPRDEEVREEVPLSRETHTRDGPGGARAILRRGRAGRPVRRPSRRSPRRHGSSRGRPRASPAPL